MRFLTFLAEAKKVSKEKPSGSDAELHTPHTYHPEDRPILHTNQEEGFHHAVHALGVIHKSLAAGKAQDGANISRKIDGTPAVFAGHTKRGFAISTKSILNKEPRYAVNDAEIDQHWGHQPELAAKLKIAHKHLQKVVHPGMGMVMGDLLHTGEVGHSDTHVHFKANVVQHDIEKGSDEAKKVKRAHLSWAPHTTFTGEPGALKPTAGLRGKLAEHPDVHSLDVKHDWANDRYTPQAQQKFALSMQAAQKAHSKASYEHTQPHGQTMSMYINHAVRKGEKRTSEGYIDFLKSTDKKVSNRDHLIAHATEHAKHFQNAFDMHHHLENAKNALIGAFNPVHREHAFSIDGKASPGEGFVSITKGEKGVLHKNKLVDRRPGGFSATNQNIVRPAKPKTKK
jgi:hypothetical protein